MTWTNTPSENTSDAAAILINMLLRQEIVMTYEVLKDRAVLDTWRVEAINERGDAEVFVTIFSGPDAEHRACEYADWKNGACELAKAS